MISATAWAAIPAARAANCTVALRARPLSSGGSVASVAGTEDTRSSVRCLRMSDPQLGRLAPAEFRAGTPRLSVVIPTLDRQDALDETLAALAAQDTADAEVIVV